MYALQWLARGGTSLALLFIIAVLPGGSLLLLFPRVRHAAFGRTQQPIAAQKRALE